MLSLFHWDSVTKIQNSNAACNRFLKIFSGFYNIAFPEQKVKIKNKTINSPWISKGPQKKETKPKKKDTIHTKRY